MIELPDISPEEQLNRWIKEGEHLTQDFKFAINDQRKIAIALVAFANTAGGRLLIGVKDNGKVAGVRDEEEFYMVEGAAQLFSKPEINFTTEAIEIEDKTVLVVHVLPSKKKPHLAQDKEGKWLAYYREDDQNKKAHPIHLAAWKYEQRGMGKLLKLAERETRLLGLLKKEPKGFPVNALAKAMNMNRPQIIQLLGELFAWKLIELSEESGTIQVVAISG